MEQPKERFFISATVTTDHEFLPSTGFDYAIYRDENGNRMKWSATFPLPAIGDRVFITMNRIGWAKVEGYFFSHGFVGVMTKAEKPPRWLVAQQKRNAENPANPEWLRNGIGCEFGAEIALTKPGSK